MTPEELLARRRQVAEWLAMPSQLAHGEYTETQERIVLLGALVAPINVPAFLEAIGRAEATAPIFNPTLYMRAADKLERVRLLAQKANAFRAEVLRQAQLELDEASL